MAAKPQTEAGYSAAGTALAERVLLEVWSRLGSYRQHLVLVGGLVPRYLVPQPPPGAPGIVPAHTGTLDVDLAISLAVADLKTYASIHSTLVDTLGFTPGANAGGRDQRHSFKKRVGHADVILDFLTTKYDGPENSLMRAVEENLSAIQVEGLGMALNDPRPVALEGELLSGGFHEATVNVCRPVPFVMLKALALANRGEPKDAYDLVYVIRYYPGGTQALAAEVQKDERAADSFAHAVAELGKSFKTVGHDGPQKYQAFCRSGQGEAVQAYAAVQEFLDALGR